MQQVESWERELMTNPPRMVAPLEGTIGAIMACYCHRPGDSIPEEAGAALIARLKAAFPDTVLETGHHHLGETPWMDEYVTIWTVSVGDEHLKIWHQTTPQGEMPPKYYTSRSSSWIAITWE